MDLTAWMVFNKHSNTTSILGKTVIHGIFKRHSNMHLLDFASFFVAIKEVLLRIHPDNLEDGWKMLGVHTSHAVGKRMSKLGVKSYLYHPHKEITAATSDLPQVYHYEAPTINPSDLTVTTPLRSIQIPKKNNLSLSKLAQIAAKPTFPVPEAEPEDSIYLKSYMLPTTEERK